MKCPKIINELYGGKITVVQLVLTMQNSVEFVKNYDNIGIDEIYYSDIPDIKHTAGSLERAVEIGQECLNNISPAKKWKQAKASN